MVKVQIPVKPRNYYSTFSPKFHRLLYTYNSKIHISCKGKKTELRKNFDFHQQ